MCPHTTIHIPMCPHTTIYMCPHTTMCPHRSDVAVLETEHAVNIMLLNLYASMLLTKPRRRSEVAVLETEHAVNVEALQALLLEVRVNVSSYYYICVLMSHI